MNKLKKFISLPKDEFAMHYQQKEHHFGFYERQGLRPSQEDAALACWLNNSVLANLTAAEIGQRLWTTYKILNQHCCQPKLAGATASTTLYDGRGHLITATLGDSVAFAVVYGEEGTINHLWRLNKVIHHPVADRERLRSTQSLIVDGRLQGAHGSLALSRALGDYEYRCLGLCDEAHIDIHELTSFLPGKIQIICTCDGFTEPVADEGAKAQEQWLADCLQAIQGIEALSEEKIAQHLVETALAKGSQDNISILVQTLQQDEACILGIYDGHGGKQTASYVAKNLMEHLMQQCALTSERYAQQRLSTHRYFELYYRDNKDEAFFQQLNKEKDIRLAELARPDGINEHLQVLLHKKEQFIDEVVVAGENVGAPMLAVLAIASITAFLESLCARYTSLELDRIEFLTCLKHVLKNSSGHFDYQKYAFLPYDWLKHRENAAYLTVNCGLGEHLKDVLLAAIEHCTLHSSVTQQGLFHHSESLPHESALENGAKLNPK